MPDLSVTLRQVTADTVRAITKLRVTPEQERYVASNAVSIAEAYFHPEAWFRAIYLDDAPVGFVMLNDQTLAPEKHPTPELGLWRFMIDADHQRRGIGGRALHLVIEHARTRPGITQLFTSCVPGAQTPRPFYERHGFVATGEIDGEEVVLALTLAEAQAIPA